MVLGEGDISFSFPFLMPGIFAMLSARVDQGEQLQEAFAYW